MRILYLTARVRPRELVQFANSIAYCNSITGIGAIGIRRYGGEHSETNFGIAAVIADNILVTTGHGCGVEVSAQQFQMAAE